VCPRVAPRSPKKSGDSCLGQNVDVDVDVDVEVNVDV